MFTKAKPLQISRILRVSAHPLPQIPSKLLFHPQARPLSSTSVQCSSSVVEGVTVDQTKHNNSPSGGKKGEHEHNTSSARTEVGRNRPAEHARTDTDTASSAGTEADSNHPAKQPDPQKSPERSTGFETDGPGSSEAGKGKDTGGVHQEKKGEPGPDMAWQGDGKPAT